MLLACPLLALFLGLAAGSPRGSHYGAHRSYQPSCYCNYYTGYGYPATSSSSSYSSSSSSSYYQHSRPISHSSPLCCAPPAAPAWSAWSPWSLCSQAEPSCQGGWRLRKRTCFGLDCQGAAEEWEQCAVQDCTAIAAEAARVWGACSAACGAGTQSRGGCAGAEERACRGTNCGGCWSRGVRSPAARLLPGERARLLAAVAAAPAGHLGDLTDLARLRLALVQLEGELGEPLSYTDFTTTNAEQANIVKKALQKTTFKDFKTELGAIFAESGGCVGKDAETIFFAVYLDLVFVYWQELQTLRGFGSVLEHIEGNKPALHTLNFDDKEQVLDNNRLRDVWDYKTSYCYTYDYLRIEGRLTPSAFLREFPYSLPRPAGAESLQLEVGDNFIVGVVLPRAVATGLHKFDLCQAAKCFAAGSVSTFGAGPGKAGDGTATKKTHYLVEYDVTELVEEQGWEGALDDGALTARLSDAGKLGVPEPVVIKRPQDQWSGGSIVLPEGTAKAYGDLLAKFDVAEFVE